MACILSTLHCAEPATAAHSLGQRCSKWKEEKGKTTLAFTLERIRFLLLEKQPNQFPGNGQQDTALSGWAGVGSASLSAAGITSMPVYSLTSMRQEALDSAFCCTLSTYFQGPRAEPCPAPMPGGGLKPRFPAPEISWVTLFGSSCTYHLTRISALSQPVPQRGTGTTHRSNWPRAPIT